MSTSWGEHAEFVVSFASRDCEQMDNGVQSWCSHATIANQTAGGQCYRPVDSLYICCCNICWVDIICGGAITCPAPMPVVGNRIEAAVILVIGLLVSPFVNPFGM